MQHTHFTVPTQFMELEDARFAYRRWGNDSFGQPPLFFLQHFRGGMDHWDPLMTDGLAAGREVILYDPRGLASSTGTPRGLIEEMADDAARPIRAMGLTLVDVVGFSLGGMIAQDLTLRHPDLVRRLMLLGTQPRGGNPDPNPKIFEVAPYPVPTVDDWRSEAPTRIGRDITLWQERTTTFRKDCKGLFCVVSGGYGRIVDDGLHRRKGREAVVHLVGTYRLNCTLGMLPEKILARHPEVQRSDRAEKKAFGLEALLNVSRLWQHRRSVGFQLARTSRKLT